MTEAIKTDNVPFASSLLSHGFPKSTYHTRTALFYNPKNILMAYLEAGWEINETTSIITPPVLGYVVYELESYIILTSI